MYPCEGSSLMIWHAAEGRGLQQGCASRAPARQKPYLPAAACAQSNVHHGLEAGSWLHALRPLPAAAAGSADSPRIHLQRVIYADAAAAGELQVWQEVGAHLRCEYDPGAAAVAAAARLQEARHRVHA